MYGGRARPPSSSPREQQLGFCAMNRLLVTLAITAAAGSLLCSSPIGAQNPPPQERAEHVEITKAPGLEIAHDDLAIIRWTSTNPGGDDDHYAVVHYGTDPKDLSQTAKNHIRLSRGHAETIFRVRLQPLKPDTTYYDGGRWAERRGGEFRQSLHHSRPGAGNQRVPARIGGDVEPDALQASRREGLDHGAGTRAS